MWDRALSLGEAGAELADSQLKRIAARCCVGGIRKDGPLSQNIGAALFLSYYARFSNDEACSEALTALLDQMNDQVASSSPPLRLHGGIVGFAWLLRHLARQDGRDADEGTSELDAALVAYLSRGPNDVRLDVLDGIVGFGVYALEGGSKPSSSALLDEVVHTLLTSASRCRSGYLWHTPPRFVPDSRRTRSPTGYFDLGLAHGGPGIVAFLAGVEFALPGLYAGIRPILRASVDALRDVQSDEGFPTYVHLDGTGGATPSRVAWCYGDLAVSVAIARAGLALEESDLVDWAVELAFRAAGREPGEASVVDACLCHGASGVAHVLLRLGKLSNCAELVSDSTRWLCRAMSLFKETDAASSNQELDEILMGQAGLGLALLAARTEQSPDWDRLLLLT